MVWDLIHLVCKNSNVIVPTFLQTKKQNPASTPPLLRAFLPLSSVSCIEKLYVASATLSFRTRKSLGWSIFCCDADFSFKSTKKNSWVQIFSWHDNFHAIITYQANLSSQRWKFYKCKSSILVFSWWLICHHLQLHLTEHKKLDEKCLRKDTSGLNGNLRVADDAFSKRFNELGPYCMDHLMTSVDEIHLIPHVFR